ncbi:unnamed protein product [marine sediment metagenome]|uniref:Uncharacterized protein n=1 Tax=marine sediment metagenome TaxID=412755 RepID=X0WQ33_9ZZZZ
MNKRHCQAALRQAQGGEPVEPESPAFAKASAFAKAMADRMARKLDLRDFLGWASHG